MIEQIVSPEYLARHHYNQGGGLSSNPYPQGSEDYSRYQWEMHKLEVNELKELCREH